MNIPWISSMAEFAPIVLPALEMVNPKTICEIGAGSGANSKILGDFLRKRHGKLISIDPRPVQCFLDWAAISSDVVTHINQYSLTALPTIGIADVWFLDGDHNWYTVYHELLTIESMANKADSPLLIFLHDMNWPCARRDMYYDPSRIPQEFLQPHSSNICITLDNPNHVEHGFKGGIWALKEGGPRNGILTAVEDFIAQSKNKYHWLHVPAVLGLGVLIDTRHPYTNQIVQYYAPYHKNPVIELLERDRVSKYIAACSLDSKIEKMTAILNDKN